MVNTSTINTNFIRIFMGGVLLGALFGCDISANQPVFMGSSLSCTEDNELDCFGASANNIELRINSKNPTTVGSASGLERVVIGGDCNTGGYFSHRVEWELLEGSGLTTVDSSNISSEGECINGRFSIQVFLRCSNLETGVNCTGPSMDHQLYIEIYGIDIDGVIYRNDLLARQSISLIPQRID